MSDFWNTGYTAPPYSLNAHGCWILCIRTGPLAMGSSPALLFGTPEAFAKALERLSGWNGAEDGDWSELQQAGWEQWAREAKPGAVDCMGNVDWIVALDPTEDRSGIVCDLYDHAAYRLAGGEL